MTDAGRDSISPHDKATEKEREARQGHKRASAAALIDAFVDEYRTDREAHNRRENHRVAREWLTIFGLFFAAGFAFLQWLELGRTDKNIERQANLIGEQLKVMHTQANAAKDSADATHDAVRLAEKTAERQLRAYIGVKIVKVFLNTSDRKLKISYEMLNSGQTPAYEVTHSPEIEIWPFPLPSDFRIGDPKERVVAKMTINPNSSVSGYVENVLKGDTANLTKEKKRLYVYGVVKYRDAFGATRHTRFAASIINFDEMMTFSSRSGEAEVGGEIEYTQQYNDSD